MYIINSIPYIFFFLICIFFSLSRTTVYCVNNIENALIYKYNDIFFSAISFIFIGCRGFVGADWLLYLPYYQSVPSLNAGINNVFRFMMHNNYEPLYALFNIVIKSIYDNYFFLQFCLFTIDFIILHYFFKEYLGRYYYLGWAFFYIFQGYILEIIILRNTKSILLFLLSIKYINTKNPKMYFILNIIGFFFHKSAIVYFPLYFIRYVPRNKILEILIFGIGNIVYILQIQWFKTFYQLLGHFLPSIIRHMCDLYFNNTHYSAGYGITIGYLERFFSYILIFLFSEQLIKQDKRLRIFIYLFNIYSYIYLYFTEFYIFIERVPTLIVCCYWILYPNIYRNLKKEWKYLFIVVFIIYGCLKTIILLDEKWAYYDNFIFGAYNSLDRKEHFTY